ncbi:MAG: phosphoribosylanthranilate isomerase [Bacteroidales bacterium]|nr:MAG: phosphoribosylanthranilate isomerase [Bacteroidales bacterium]
MSSKNINIKVCGMRDENNIRELVKINPDYIGFIFYPKSKRFVGENFNLKILDYIPERIKKVGVFVKASKEFILEKINMFRLDFIQLHGGESSEFCRELDSEGIPVIKAFSVNEEFDFNTINPFKPYCKYFMFDTQCSTYGGSSTKYNWNIFSGYDNEKPFFLSGGISDEDSDLIRDLKNLNIHAVDINSRFEKEPGLKDISKIRKFIKNLKY